MMLTQAKEEQEEKTESVLKGRQSDWPTAGANGCGWSSVECRGQRAGYKEALPYTGNCNVRSFLRAMMTKTTK